MNIFFSHLHLVHLTYDIVYDIVSWCPIWNREFKSLWNANAEIKVEQTPNRFHWSIPSSFTWSLTLARSYRCYSESLARNAFIAQKRYTSSFIHRVSELGSAVQSVARSFLSFRVMKCTNCMKFWRVSATCVSHWTPTSEGRRKRRAISR